MLMYWLRLVQEFFHSSQRCNLVLRPAAKPPAEHREDI